MSKTSSPPFSHRRAALFLLALLLGVCVCGCRAVPAQEPRNGSLLRQRHFNFQTDTFAFPNELYWVYEFTADGKWTTHKRDPKPTYAQHCFVVARSVRQFFDNARFDPALPVADEATYRRLIRRVVKSSPRQPLPEDKKIIIPGYPDLRAFSEAQEPLLKAECGSRWESYFQRGHWRMIFPFSRRHQERLAAELIDELQAGRPPVLHLLRFPQLTINHAVVVFAAKPSTEGTAFSIYDPNHPEAPGTLTFDRETRTFLLPHNNYFAGGRVDAYEVYRGFFK